MIRSFVLLLAGAACHAQQVGIGVKGGVRLTGEVDGTTNDESKRYLVGAMIEVLLPHGFGIEADAVYGRFGYGDTVYLLGYSTERARDNLWQVPIVAKYRLRKPLHSYALVGYSFERAGGRVDYSGVQTNPYVLGYAAPFSGSYAIGNSTDHGVVAGGGIEIGAGHIHVAPEVRYIRWKDPLYAEYGSRGYCVAVAQNEVQILVGLSWR